MSAVALDCGIGVAFVLAMLVMVVDDNADTREVMMLALAARGYEIVTAATGLEALTILRTGVRPNLIILDLMMPEMDGFQFRAEQLKDGHLAAIPVVVCSARNLEPHEAARLGAVPFVGKPVQPHRLLRLVQEHQLQQ